MEQLPHQALQEMSAAPSTLATERNRVQVALATLAFPDIAPRLALKHWVGSPDAPDTWAAKFGQYADAHPQEAVDIGNPAALRALLERVRGYRGSSLH